mgnify:CR=1 FL=1
MIRQYRYNEISVTEIMGRKEEHADVSEQVARILADVRRDLEEMSAYVDVGECLIEESETEDVDWVNNWKQYFHQFYIDDILVIPSWEQVEEKDKSSLQIKSQAKTNEF